MNRKKFLIVAIAVILVFLLPLFSMAQVFTLSEEDGNGRLSADGGVGWSPGSVVDPETNEYAPLGNGFLILAASAGLYLLLKTRKSRRTKTVMLAALALTLGTTQCHKPTENGNASENEVPETKTIYISLTCGNGFGPKADINVSNGKITWNNGDQVYVVYDGKLLSTTSLTVQPNSSNPQWGTISGSITVTEEIGENPTFTFYYVGSGVDFTPGAYATSLTFDISDQSEDKDVGEYMVGRTAPINMTGSDGKYGPVVPNATIFKPITSVVWVKTDTDFGECQMKVTGNKAMNKMTIDLENPETLACEHTNDIIFQGGADVAVSVMPATAESVSDEAAEKVTLNFIGNDKAGSLTMNYGIKPGRVYARVSGNLASPIPVSAIEGALPGVFSVSATKQVYFSKGNLQYLAKGGENGNATNNAVASGASVGGTWKFADNQYTIIGNTTENKTPKYDSSNWIDLFGWGTSGYNHGATNYQPWSRAGTTANDCKKYYAYGLVSAHLYDGEGDMKGKADWGYNRILNGGNKENCGWRTPTGGENGEWNYLLCVRTDFRGFGTVNSTKGIIILPDGWVKPDGLNFTATIANYTTNKYTTDQWKKMEAAGAVFLPYANYVNNTSYKTDYAFYWSSTSSNNEDSCDVLFYNTALSVGNRANARPYGFPVRLIMDAK